MAFGATALALALWVAAPANPLAAVVSIVAAALQFARQAYWRPLVTRDRPILWILHVSYAWIALGLALLGLSQAGWISGSAGLHALTVGATGGLIMGMVTRTARGHTGRPLKVSRAEVLAYVLVLAAAVLRVLLPLVAPQWTVGSVSAAAVAWTAAFAIYVWMYAPWLMRTRVDGKDGHFVVSLAGGERREPQRWPTAGARADWWGSLRSPPACGAGAGRVRWGSLSLTTTLRIHAAEGVLVGWR